MEMPSAQTVEVKIYNQTYTIRGDSNSDYIMQLAEYVDRRMKEVSAGTLTADSLRVAILTALNIADELLKEKDGMIADTLARAHFVNGDASKALETQERALKLAKGNPQLENDQEMKKRLEEYRKAAKK